MILLAGQPTEPPIRLAAAAADQAGIPYLVLDERDAAGWDVEVRVEDGRTAGTIAGHDLGDIRGVYLRTTGSAPTRTDDPADGLRQRAAVRLLTEWAEYTPARVANRLGPSASNHAKPYQAGLIERAGLRVPPMLVTNDPDAVREFRRRHGSVVYKSASGVRSVVRELDDTRDRDLHRVRTLPTLFQRRIHGDDVRVHVVGDALFATTVRSAAVDYRYGDDTTMAATDLPPAIADRCRALAKNLALPLCGIDLLRDDGGQWWCLEANPAPAFSAFEAATGQPIARALVDWLAA